MSLLILVCDGRLLFAWLDLRNEMEKSIFYIIELERNRLALFTVSIQLLIIHKHTPHITRYRVDGSGRLYEMSILSKSPDWTILIVGPCFETHS